jgi:hypothetical protein
VNSAFAILLTYLALLLPGLAVAGSPVISGHTSANAESIEGIRKLLGILVCPRLDSIDAESAPDGFDPKSAPKLPSTLAQPPLKPIRYEFWTVAGSGRNMKVLIQLWYNASGNELYGASPPRDWLKSS